ncbi:hypothetical protein ACTG16_22865 [Aeromonas sp. 23P]|uniref:hypothetical protein n=1 Tax=Aeromonas sp. 23P TaxID=3452716 RepID=UPI003F799F41
MHQMNNEQAKALATSILNKMTEQGFTLDNRPSRSLKEAVGNLERLHQESCAQVRAFLSDKSLLGSPFGFLIMPTKLKSWDGFHRRVSRLRSELNKIINKQSEQGG